MTTLFPHAGQSFTLTMDNGLQIINSYRAEKDLIRVEFLSGDLTGTVMEVPFRWRELPDGSFLLSWQESDNNTVVHCDNFNTGISYAYYTTMAGDFYVMEGTIRPGGAQ